MSACVSLVEFPAAENARVWQITTSESSSKSSTRKKTFISSLMVFQKVCTKMCIMLREPNQPNRSTYKDKQTLTESLAMSCARSTFQYNRLVKGTRQDGTVVLQGEPLNLIYVDTHQSIQAGKALQILFKCQPGAEQTRQRHSPQGDRSWGLSLPSASSRSSRWAR